MRDRGCEREQAWTVRRLRSGVGMNSTGTARGRRSGALPVLGTSLKKLHKQNRDRMSFQCNENGEVWEKVGIE